MRTQTCQISLHAAVQIYLCLGLLILISRNCNGDVILISSAWILHKENQCTISSFLSNHQNLQLLPIGNCEKYDTKIQVWTFSSMANTTETQQHVNSFLKTYNQTRAGKCIS